MSNYTVTAEQLRENTNVLIQGKLGFARLNRLIEGAELATVSARRVQNGMQPINTPHTTVNLSQPQVLCADPANPTPEEIFVKEHCFVSKKNPDRGLQYSLDSKGNSLPVIMIPSEQNPGQFEQDTSGQELATGLDVTLVLRTYKPKNYNKRGIALETVLVNEPVRYYQSNNTMDALAARGIVVAGPIVPLQAGNTPQGEAAPIAPIQGSDMPGTVMDGGYPMPGPGGAAPQAPAAPAAPQGGYAPAQYNSPAPSAPQFQQPQVPAQHQGYQAPAQQPQQFQQPNQGSQFNQAPFQAPQQHAQAPIPAPVPQGYQQAMQPQPGENNQDTINRLFNNLAPQDGNAPAPADAGQSAVGAPTSGPWANR